MGNTPTLHQVLLKFYREKTIDPDYLASLPLMLIDHLYDKKYIVKSTISEIRLSSIGTQTAEGIIVQRYFKAEELLRRCVGFIEQTDAAFLYIEMKDFLGDWEIE